MLDPHFVFLGTVTGLTGSVRYATARPRHAAIALLTIDAWEPDAWAFPGYMLVLSLTLTTIIGLRRPRTRSSSPGVS